MTTPTVYPPQKAKFQPGINDLLTKHPLIAQELLYDNPSQIMASSVKKVSWKCLLCEKIWEAAPKSRTGMFKPSIGCADCSRTLALAKRGKKNTLFDVYPELAKELLNIEDAKKVTQSSHQVLTWICERNHEYDLSVNKRFYGRGCHFCAFKEVLIGFNNLGAVRKDLVSQLVDEKNSDLIANDRQKIKWFHIAKGGIRHEWEASCLDRAYLGYNCLVCAGVVVQYGVNDFKSQFLDDTDYVWSDKNEGNPESITFGSNKKVELICKKHKQDNYMLGSAKMFSNGSRRCQDCKTNSEKFVSKAEIEIVEFVKTFIEDDKVEQSVRRFKSRGVYEIDILVDNKVAIDFNGHYWHQEGVFKPVGYHAAKRKAVEDLGFVFIEVEEMDWINNKETIKESLSRTIRKETMS